MWVNTGFTFHIRVSPGSIYNTNTARNSESTWVGSHPIPINPHKILISQLYGNSFDISPWQNDIETMVPVWIFGTLF